VEIQELACKALIANVRFPLSPLIIDNRGTLIQRMSAALDATEFAWRENGVDVFTTDEHNLFRIGGRDLVASCEHFSDLEAAAGKIRTFVETGLEFLDVEQVLFLGIRTHWVAATDSFDELRERLLDNFAGGAAKLANLAGKQSTDVGWTFEFHGSDPRVTVRMGPMKSEQAMRQIFRVEDPALYPPEFLFLDVDRVLADDPQPAHEIIARFNRALEHNLTLAEKFGRYLTTLDT
jgi:phosphoglycolate phosphatase-like HAD superfamily hydrolase